MEQLKIDRINELYRKSKAEGLTEAEKKEQTLLRKEFVADVKKNLTAQLNNIDIQNEDGTIENLGEKYGNKPKSFRKEHLAIRNAMSEKEVAEKSGVIVKRLLQTGWYQNAQEIFAYYPLKNEVDCRALFLQAWSDGKKIALPRTREENQMDFYYIDDFMQLKEGAFHVMEPMENCVRAVPDKQPVIVPGSVFGRDGSRYGYGKGYYDRFFAKNPKLKRYAVCYANQLEESLVTDIYDVEMHEIYTETEVIRKGV